MVLLIIKVVGFFINVNNLVLLVIKIIRIKIGIKFILIFWVKGGIKGVNNIMVVVLGNIV